VLLVYFVKDLHRNMKNNYVHRILMYIIDRDIPASIVTMIMSDYEGM